MSFYLKRLNLQAPQAQQRASVRPRAGRRETNFRQLDVEGDELADNVYTSRESQKLKDDAKHKKTTFAFHFFG